MSQVFPNVYVLPTSPDLGNELQNIILVATKSKDFRSSEDIRVMQRNLENIINKSDSTYDNIHDRIEYADYLSDTRNINFDDVPIITDQLAPVEMLLNPITSEPYNVGKQVSTNQRVDPFSVQGNAVTFGFPAGLLIIWIIYMLRIWGKERITSDHHHEYRVKV